MKVLLHIDEVSKWQMVVNNAKNLLVYIMENKIEDYEIEIVANGPVVKDLVKGSNEELVTELNKLMERKVVVAACKNALNANDIAVDELLKGIRIVPAAIAELIVKQEAGFAYVKP